MISSAVLAFNFEGITVLVGENALQDDSQLMQIADALNPLRLCFVACETAINKSAAKTPMMAITTSNSTRVKALRCLFVKRRIVAKHCYDT